MSNFIKYYCHKDSKTGEAEIEVKFAGLATYGSADELGFERYIKGNNLIEVTPEEHRKAFAKYHPEFVKEEPKAKEENIFSPQLILDGTPFFEITTDNKVLVLGRECFSDKEVEDAFRKYLEGVFGIPEKKEEPKTKEVDSVGEALEKVKKEMVTAAIFAGDFIEATQTLVNAIEAERNSKAVVANDESKIDIQSQIDQLEIEIHELELVLGNKNALVCKLKYQLEISTEEYKNREVIDIGVGEHKEDTDFIFQNQRKSFIVEFTKNGLDRRERFATAEEALEFCKGKKDVTFIAPEGASFEVKDQKFESDKPWWPVEERPESIWKDVSELPEIAEWVFVKSNNDKISAVIVEDKQPVNFAGEKFSSKGIKEFCTMSDFFKEIEELKARVSKLEGR